ncbi:UvrD-helicase domain-containing protein [Candidatus Daviesbacteria bacterium]|nr:UvrD-helicase domain-containing protein [Candidatus Daviesbacteria bacterium]
MTTKQNMPNLLDDLNPAQQQAVMATDGPVLILAGAGSGKTRVLTYRVAFLIAEKKIPAENILVVTFTNKAAGEMKERILRLISRDNHPLMGTFHSICAKILRKEGYQLGLKPGFSIYDEQDSMDAIKEAMANLNLAIQKTNPHAIRNTISSAKNELISELEYPQYARGYFQETVAKVYLEYQKILTQNQALDFDDLLMKTIQLFQISPPVLTRYQLTFKYILVDEYQDTNAAQYQLIKMLAARSRNLCVVGDASQSIYGFRGADFRNIVNFQKDYKEAKVFNLEQNYRSTQIILDAAQAVISANRTHPILKLWTDKKIGPKILVYEAKSEVDEANFIIQTVKENNLSLNSVAILYRTNAQSRSLEEAFLKHGVPYTLIGGIKFYERKEIKDVLSFLRLLQNEKDSVSKKRVEKIGKGRSQKFYELSENLNEKLDQFSTLELLDAILAQTGYLAYLDDGSDQGKYRIENVKELRSVAEEFPSLVEFLENVALVQNEEMPNGTKRKSINSSEAITLMTIHASKGLEFPVIFIVGMEEGLFPHSRAMLNPTELEEERRLAYVAITRAKDQLFLTYARSRLYFGQRSNNLVSRFLVSIPENLFENRLKKSEDFNEDISSPVSDDEEWLNV